MRTLPALAPVLILMSLGSWGVPAGRVSTRPELTAQAGASVLLECFLECSPGEGAWTVTKADWLHLPENKTEAEETIFYYYSNYSVPVGRFRHRVHWLGDLARRNSSVRLQDVQAADSGTYTCEIRVLGQSSVFKNYTLLRVARAGRKSSGFAGAQGSKSSGWGAVMGYVCAAAVLALLLGCGLKKSLQKQRRSERGTLRGTRGERRRDKPEEGIYSLTACPETLKAGQEAERWSGTDTTYITMHPSAAFRGAGPAPLENNVYVQLERKKVPAEGPAEGRRGEEGARQSKDACAPSAWPEEEFPCAPDGGNLSEPSLAPWPCPRGRALPTPAGCRHAVLPPGLAGARAASSSLPRF